ncbi:MAG: hypothetical protein RMA76_28145 [Deltaproteobacteria bacterium]
MFFPKMGVIALLLLTACVSAQKPPGFAVDARPVPLETPGFGGGNLEGYALDTDRRVQRGWASSGTHYHAERDDTLEISDAAGVVWRATCSVRADGKRRPNLWLVCLYTSERPDQSPMTLALAAESGEPLDGAFLVGDDAWRVVGSRHLDVNEEVADTVSWVVRRPGEQQWLAWVDHTGWAPKVWRTERLGDDELRRLAPLFLTFVKVRDARYLYRSSSGFAAFDDAEPWPAAEGAPERAAHVTRLQVLGLDGAARVLAGVARGEAE